MSLESGIGPFNFIRMFKRVGVFLVVISVTIASVVLALGATVLKLLPPV